MMVQKAFYEFVGKSQAKDISIARIVALRNEQLETQFFRTYHDMMHRLQAIASNNNEATQQQFNASTNTLE